MTLKSAIWTPSTPLRLVWKPSRRGGATTPLNNAAKYVFFDWQQHRIVRWQIINWLSLLQKSCGGNGYSAYSGLSGLLADFAVMCTWEGDNTVLAQQTARFLLNAAAKSQKGEKLDGSFSFSVRMHPILIALSDFTSYLAGGFASLNNPEMKSFPARTGMY